MGACSSTNATPWVRAGVQAEKQAELVGAGFVDLFNDMEFAGSTGCSMGRLQNLLTKAAVTKAIAAMEEQLQRESKHIVRSIFRAYDKNQKRALDLECVTLLTRDALVQFKRVAPEVLQKIVQACSTGVVRRLEVLAARDIVKLSANYPRAIEARFDQILQSVQVSVIKRVDYLKNHHHQVAGDVFEYMINNGTGDFSWTKGKKKEFCKAHICESDFVNLYCKATNKVFEAKAGRDSKNRSRGPSPMGSPISNTRKLTK